MKTSGRINSKELFFSKGVLVTEQVLTHTSSYIPTWLH